jgi:hypothetical protein
VQYADQIVSAIDANKANATLVSQAQAVTQDQDVQMVDDGSLTDADREAHKTVKMMTIASVIGGIISIGIIGLIVYAIVKGRRK